MAYTAGRRHLCIPFGSRRLQGLSLFDSISGAGGRLPLTALSWFVVQYQAGPSLRVMLVLLGSLQISDNCAPGHVMGIWGNTPLAPIAVNIYMQVLKYRDKQARSYTVGTNFHNHNRNRTHRTLNGYGIMADTSKLWFYIYGRPEVSSVSVSLNETINDLKEKIYGKYLNSFAGCDAPVLIITKVRFIMVSMNTDVINGLCWPITPAGR